MAFEGLSDKLAGVFKNLRGRGKVTEKDIKEAMREIRLALLEADVNFKVVKDFVTKVSERAGGSAVLDSLTPAQQIIKIVNDELTELMGGAQAKLNIPSRPPAIIMAVGLQGAGKTTHVAKLAGYYKSQGKRPLLAACDVYRPAAIEQLKVVGAQVGVPVFEMGQGDPVKIAAEAIAHADKHGNDIVFIDTAGRLHINEELMDELAAIKTAVKPSEIILVLDAMTGQDAANSAEQFNEKLGIDSVLLTKMDGDTRGGAALSVRAMTGKPIKFIGTGEKLDKIEPFFPDRMASRILGMGDVLSLIEKAQQSFDEKAAAELEKKMRTNKLDLEDYLTQLREIKKMGSVNDLLGMIPGMGKQLQGAKIDEKQFGRTEAIILSMTPKERRNPDVLNFSRKKRVSAGCGCKVEEINRLLKQFKQMQEMTKMMSRGKMPKGMSAKGMGKLPF